MRLPDIQQTLIGSCRLILLYDEIMRMSVLRRFFTEIYQLILKNDKVVKFSASTSIFQLQAKHTDQSLVNLQLSEFLKTDFANKSLSAYE